MTMKKTRTVWGEYIHDRTSGETGEEVFVAHKGPMQVPVRLRLAKRKRYLKRHEMI
jgi:hypothetical protein